MQVRRSVGLVIATATLVITAACGGATGDPTAESGDSAEAEGPLEVGVTIHQADIYFQGVADAVDAAVSEGGGSSTMVNTQTDASKEATGFQNLVTSQVDGIVASPLSPEGSLASVKSAASAGIPIVCYNTCVGDDSEEYAAAFVESDQKDLGTRTGEFAVKVLKDAGKEDVTLGMLNCNRYEACKERQDGFLEALKAGGINATVAADQEALDPAEGSKLATDILTGNPEIDVMWASSQGPTEGLVSAVKAAGKIEDVQIFGTDVSPSLVNSIKAGDLKATTGQNSKETGELAVEYLRKAIAGEEIDPFSTKIDGVLYSSDDESLLDSYLSEN